jgi:beta-1,4-mannosyl-glycoprotein beta-1,4-N-acetylglucosaminyltransferase
MRVYDSFLFRDELDILECRLTQLEGTADFHILVESPEDHQGHPKPLYYEENQDRFAPWKDRIIHVVTELAGTVAMEREGQQREAVRTGLAGADPDDMLILADADEIPSPLAMQAVRDRVCGVVDMKCCFFYADLMWGTPLRTSVYTTVAAATAKGMMATRRGVWAEGPVICQEALGGHHLSFLGGPEAVRAKLDAHCHTELNGDVETWLIKNDPEYNPFGQTYGGGPLLPVDVDSTWPRWITERRCPPSWFRPRE